jgi:arabinan endo-1,5-alpha-L-arabinosidase
VVVLLSSLICLLSYIFNLKRLLIIYFALLKKKSMLIKFRNYFCIVLWLSLASLWLQSCEEDPANPEDPTGTIVVDPSGPEEDEEDDNSLNDYVAPDYADDYSAVASWNERHKWNLANVHDPTVEKCGDYYYMYQTDASYGNAHEGHGHFFYRRSKDLVDWEFQGAVMSDAPYWVKDTLNNMRNRLGLPAIDRPSYGYWAPVVRKAGNKYRMYYTIVIDNYIQTGKQNTMNNFDGSWTERAFIGLMETDDLGSNLWTDKGMVVCSASDRGKNWLRPDLDNWNAYFKWNAIDPSFIITPEGEHWLIYGSWHSGIVALRLDPETGKPSQLGEPWEAGALSDYGIRIYTRNGNSRWQASEAPEIVYNAETGYYYLFLAYDELSVAYNTRVCRSRSITGPYTSYTGTSVSAGGNAYPLLTHPYKFNQHSGWVGISHCCVFRDDSGNWYYSSQGRLPANTNGNAYSNAIMMGHVRKIRWTDNGWPVVMPERYAAVPDVAIEESELAGTWENITLKYDFGKQQTSQLLTLSDDHTITGVLSGTWSWDADRKVLTVGSQTLYVERETDWEASPRIATLVYAGLNSAGESLWGKLIRK